jgi:Lrp/AsnC family transcriptional regulator, leucine-responsive regulatory protein
MQSKQISRNLRLITEKNQSLGLTAHINVRLNKHTQNHERSPMDAFRAGVQTRPEGVECAALTGEKDCLLRVVVQDMVHTGVSSWRPCSNAPGVKDHKTRLVLDRIKNTTAMPV